MQNNTLEIIPFGKYKGQPVEVLQHDKQYLDWLKDQAWFRRSYPSINTIIVNNFKEPSHTPEHNKLQVKFIDKNYCNKFVDFLIAEKYIPIDEDWKTYVYVETRQPVPKRSGYTIPSLSDCPKSETYKERKEVINKIPIIYTYSACLFEQEKADVLLLFNTNDYPDGKMRYSLRMHIEIKPILSDDFPAVLRQCKNNDTDYLLVNTFDAEGATFEVVKEVFKRSGIKLILFSDFENRRVENA